VAVHFGDVPTWIAAIGTVGALFAALIQINTERARRHHAEEREREERRRSQAQLVPAFPGPVEWPPDPNREVGRSAVDCINASPEPVYNVVVGIVFIQGAGPRTTEDVMKVMLGQNTSPGVPTTTLNVLPPGRSRAWIGRSDWTSFIGARAGAEIAFTDRSGVHWIRRANGELIELPVDPLTYFAEFGFSGPHEFQTPEPLG
jgi:hypothetical protein